MSAEWLHADDCAVTRYCSCGGRFKEWKSADGYWEGDEEYCTCNLKARMERYAVYGDERLTGALPFALSESR